ncbi:MAG: hypothetical protein GXP53_13735, partial [Deltaproteobacteria bacterium]|nr:hypothetical protein [Deltaproteobacteria bacterium]
IDINIFYNSSKVTYAGYDTNTFLNAGDTVVTPEVVDVQDDSGNADNDSDTDKMIQMSWTSSSDTWPDVSLPALLEDLNFTVNESLQEGDELPFSIIDNSHATGYSFCGQGIVATVNIWNLDVDGDGSVFNTSDGLMIARYLFHMNGSAGWTSDLVTAGATRSEEEIGEYIQAGVDNLILDVDGDGSVFNTSDGLMVARYLFHMNGSAGWTSDLVTTGATRDEAAIGTYINSLK